MEIKRVPNDRYSDWRDFKLIFENGIIYFI